LNKRGMIVIITGPSGSGKTTIYKELLKRSNDLTFSISYTTRKKRPVEIDGVDYFFVSKEEFERKIKNKDFVEWAIVHGDLYGTERKQIIDYIDKGKICILDVDIQGALNIIKIFSDAVTIFILAPSMKELEIRLRKRASECEDKIKLRLKNAENELECRSYFKYIITNNDLDDAINLVNKIIESEIRNRR